MTEHDPRLLTAEQLDRDLLAVYSLGVAYQGGDAMRRIERHIAAQAEQIDRQAVLMAWLHSLGGRGYSDEACEELDGDLGVSWRRRDDPNRERVLDEIEAIRRHGVEVARRNDANRP